MINKSELQVEYVDIATLIPYARNSKEHPEEQIQNIVNSMNEFGMCDPIGVWTNPQGELEIVEGHGRVLALNEIGEEKAPIIRLDHLTDEQRRAYSHVHNQTTLTSGFDEEILAMDLDELDFKWEDFGFDIPEEDTEPVDETVRGSLNDRFLVPPFSVFDARQGYWNARKRIWKNLICDVGQARSDAEVYQINVDYAPEFDTGVSILDPVLAEIVTMYFCPGPGAKCFDVFAGDTVFGYVSSYLGNEFTGIELRQEQADFNNERVAGLNAKYICDDGRNVLNHIPEKSQDFLFSCPPYFDLEVYSDLENDASNQETFEEFYAILDEAFANAVKALKDDSFAVIVIGNVRGKKNGCYYDFRGEVVRTFENAGMQLYNDAILITPIGTAAMRSSVYMRSRKLANVHQQVLVFYKGDTSHIRDKFGDVSIDETLGGFIEG